MLRLPKRLILLSFVLLSGCSVKYKINIDKYMIEEDVDIIETDKSKFDKKNELLFNTTPRDYLNINLKWPTPIYQNQEINPYEPLKMENVNYYNKKDISTSDYIGINYKYRFNNMFENSNILNTCYKVRLIENGDVLIFETLNDFTCFDKYKILDDVEVEVNSKCEVLEANFDYENKFSITKDNYKNKKLYIKLDCSEKQEKKEINNNLNVIAIILIYLVACGLLVIILLSLRKKNNRI